MNVDYAKIQEEIRAARSEPRAKTWQLDPAQLIGLSANQVAEAIRSHKITSEEAVVAFLERICAVNPKLNAVVMIDAKAALQRAREADIALANGIIWGPLHGVPFTIKDTYKTKGLRTTAGYLPLANYVPTENAVVVQRLHDAGAVLMGKTNTPSLAMDMQTTNLVFGTTVNVLNPELTAGGSSGGSSVAVAARMTPFEFGTDLAGSIRVPAAFNGVYGFRPTFGLVSMRGHVPPRPDELDGIRRMATAGPITHTIEDLSMLLDVVGGPGKGDHRLDPIPPAPSQKLALKDVRIAWTDSFGGVPVASEIKNALQAYVNRLEAAGASVTKTEPKDFPYVKAWETWGSFVGAQGGYEQSNFKRSLGNFFTKNAVAATPMQRNIVGPITVPKYMEAMKNQDDCIEHLETFFDDFDVWLVPVSSTTAFVHQKPTKKFGDFFVYGNPIDVDGVPVPYYVATQSYTTIFSLTESPVVALPISQNQKGSPIGIQMVGRRFADHRLLEIAEAFDKVAR
ncbi:MAG: amidase [Agitococcus sp.]|nr:amidase [Agitococcus sp.]